MPLRVYCRDRRKLNIKVQDLNLQQEEGFEPIKDLNRQEARDSNVRKSVIGKLESSTSHPFVNDFWYRSAPLLRNHDVMDPAARDRTDWHFQPGRTYGFVKCAFKLVDGWEEPRRREEPEGQQPAVLARFGDTALASADLDDEVRETDEEKLKRSFGFSEELSSYAFDAKKLVQRFKDPDNVPSRVRVRIYLVRAVCMYSKGSAFADPYIDLWLGRSINVNMRNAASVNDNTPEFYTVEERDVELPEDSRLEVRLMDMANFQMYDQLIGSTVIDLEDRWHSKALKRLDVKPSENRSLYTSEYPGKNRGSIEMWIELLDSTQVDDKPFIARPPVAALEIRIVIWTAEPLIFIEEEYNNVMISTKLSCKNYGGYHPDYQETDTHNSCKRGSSAVFNYRMVYPKINMPTDSCTLTVSMYHHTVLSNTLIGSVELDIKKYLYQVAKDSDKLIVGPSDIPFKHVNEDGEEEDAGSVNMTLYVLTQVEANGAYADLGRGEGEPLLVMPTAGRSWGDVLPGLPNLMPGFWFFAKKLIPLVFGSLTFFSMAIIINKTGVLS